MCVCVCEYVRERACAYTCETVSVLVKAASYIKSDNID